MKPVLLNNSRIPKILSFFSPIEIWAITIWPFIFCRGVMSEKDVNHESIHIEQYNDLFVVGFLVVYLYDWVSNYIKYRNDYSGYKSAGSKAYFLTRAEIEAYANDDDLSYLNKRKRYEWLSKG